MSINDSGQKAIRSPTCPGYITQAGTPNGCQSKLPAGQTICRTCSEEIRVFRESNTPNNMLPKSSRGLFGPQAEARRIAQQAAKPRPFGTPDGAVANTNLVPTVAPVEPMPAPTDTTPLDGMVDDGPAQEQPGLDPITGNIRGVRP